MCESVATMRDGERSAATALRRGVGAASVACAGGAAAYDEEEAGRQTKELQPPPFASAQAMLSRRLRRRSWFIAGAGAALCGVSIVTSGRSEPAASRVWQNAMICAAPFVFMVLVACVCPDCPDNDNGDPMRSKAYMYASTGFFGVAVNQFRTGALSSDNECGALTSLPGLLMVVAFGLVPLFGWYHPRWYWPAGRVAQGTIGGLQLARVYAQTHAVRLADAAAAIGASTLLPMPVAQRCQASPTFLPGQLPWELAVCWGGINVLLSLMWTPSVRVRAATLAERLGLPAARVFHLADGVLLADAGAESTSSSSSGLFGAKKTFSLWSGKTSVVSASDLCWKRSPHPPFAPPPPPLSPRIRSSLERLLRAKVIAAKERKCQRLAANHAQARGKLVWTLLRRAQKRDEKCKLSLISKDALRVVVGWVVKAETARLEAVYSVRAGIDHPLSRGVVHGSPSTQLDDLDSTWWPVALPGGVVALPLS